jgi:FMN-dependent NADH-azoreductase
MKKILLITASPRGEASHSRKVAWRLVDRLQTENPGSVVIIRDLDSQRPPHISADFVAGRALPDSSRTESQRAAMTLSGQFVDELFTADFVVIASGMINFGMSTPLKGWFDHVLVAGMTFKYSDVGVEGLVRGKKVYLVVASGGVYSVGPMQSRDFHGSHITALLGFMGMTDLEVIRIEGTALGPDAAESALGAALEQVSEVNVTHA